jgi:predicted RNA-binding protein with PUA-like domain
MWSKASVRGGHWIVVPINKEEHLAHLKANPKQAAALIADRGNRLAWGPVTNAKRLNPAKAFQAKVWVPQKRNQILRNVFLITPTTHITPVVPDELDPTAVILYYNSVGFTDTASVISLIEAYARDLPEPAAVAQFYDHETEADLPKWLIAFDNPADAEVYRTRKEWLETVLIKKGCKFNIGPCGKSAKPLKSAKPVQKTQSKKKRGGGTPRGRGRGGK